MRRIQLTATRAQPVEREKFEKRVFRVDALKRAFFFQAESEAETHAWIGAINTGLRLADAPDPAEAAADPARAAAVRSPSPPNVAGSARPRSARLHGVIGLTTRALRRQWLTLGGRERRMPGTRGWRFGSQPWTCARPLVRYGRHLR